MKLSHTLGTTACAALLAVSGLASADNAARNTYQTNGYTVSTSDLAGGAICNAFGLKVGAPSSSTIAYPGAGGLAGSFTLISTGTSPAANTTGSGVTSVCLSQGAVPSTGLDGATITFSCYENSSAQSAPPATPAATIVTTFAAAKTSDPVAGRTVNVEAVSALTVGTSTCNFTSDTTWTSE
jgi:hypothetical protein